MTNFIPKRVNSFKTRQQYRKSAKKELDLLKFKPEPNY